MTDINPNLASLAVPLADLKLAARNVKQHGDRSVDAIAASLAAYGQQKPIVVLEDGTVIAGNGTLLAAQKLGWEALAAVRFADAAKARAYAIADNRTPELAPWDDGELAATLEELSREPGWDAAALGYTDNEVADLIAAERPEPAIGGEDPGPGEAPAEPVSQVGEVYLLGPHRLMCGNSTQAADVAKLMNGERAVLCATDPPYLVDYDGTNHPQSFQREKAGKDNNKHWDSYHDPEASVSFFATFLKVAMEHALVENPAFYQWHAFKRQALVEQAWNQSGLLTHQQIIWVKSRPVLTRSHFMWQHEPCFYGWIEGCIPNIKPPCGGECTTVWTIDQQGESDGIHPTQKPLEIFTRPISYHTRPEDLIYEPFSGSGTQIISAAKLGRRCYAMEIEPAFVDVARIRYTSWARSAGLDPGPGALE